ncbi:glycosyltransferase family 39 protein [Aerolutibacter ruishenii]|uniref:4-amino-4-deoxy-L-arabinose transferase-like glycosyltransferase n=1 Tax=Aerolutibacter ruishenii TaxID=686800 RepID=A0A562LGP2_9GAMM|nr:glycosyltransferase family 39 protein [Lysobacter ruishenii]TWI06767.1 4-amino-4-deoxy-L-arabinose transferase-like glycosyltransferase [Lysobacter ruishenii]
MMDVRRSRLAFLVLFVAVLLAKCVVAARLPLFVDEAFYWQEGQHLAAAYSDLPGLTAWLTRLGVSVGGDTLLGVRWPFLLMGALVPWLMVALARREFGAAVGWQAGSLALLLPLSGTLGVLGLPDVALALATLLCLDAGARLLRRADAGAACELAVGLALGALSHYRFVAVIGVGFVALLLLPEGRRALRNARVWAGIAIGALAWMPLLAWNLSNADAGLRFQLVERHPWAFHLDGLWFIGIQALLATPLLLVAMLAAARQGIAGAWPSAASRYLAWSGGLLLLGFFLLGFVADNERVSFHWPLPGYLALLPLVPWVLAAWPTWARRATWALLGLGMVAVLGYYVAVSAPHLRERAAVGKAYPENFAGWDVLADAVRGEQATLPAGAHLLADNFKIGAELGFALGNPRIPVLDHPLNHHHGRAPQLRLWGLHRDAVSGIGDGPVLLVVGATDVPYKALLARYHALCAMVGPLPAPRVVNIDHGRRRFMLFRLHGRRVGPCTTPAMAWLDAPVAGAAVDRTLEVRGWAFKDGVGLSRVELLLDGQPVGDVPYGQRNTGIAAYWQISTDPSHPHVGLGGRMHLGAVAPGTHWLGLRLHGRDGSVEDWAEQPVRVR